MSHHFNRFHFDVCKKSNFRLAKLNTQSDRIRFSKFTFIFFRIICSLNLLTLSLCARIRAYKHFSDEIPRVNTHGLGQAMRAINEHKAKQNIDNDGRVEKDNATKYFLII